MTTQRKKLSIRSFQRQVIIFVAVTVLVFGAVVYFSFSRTVIAVTPIIQAQSIDIELTVSEIKEASSPDEGAPPTIEGTVMKKDVAATVTVPALLEKREEPARAGGAVTIVNNWSRTQPLQAGTRLLSEDGILFRTVERVDVPAGGSVETTVLADEAGKTGEVASGRFELVALWPGLKSQIYAESTEPFTGGTRQIARVTQNDLNEARKAALGEFEKQAKAVMDAELATSAKTGQEIVAVLPEITKEDPGAAVDEEKSSFPYTLTGSAVGIAVSPSVLHDALLGAAAQKIPADHRLKDIDENGKTITVLHADTEKKSATMAVTVKGKTVIRLSSTIFARGTIAGLDRQEIQSHFSQFDDIASIDIHFSPFWVLRAPRLPDHIEIQLKEPSGQ